MFVHLGDDIMVKKKDIVIILNDDVTRKKNESKKCDRGLLKNPPGKRKEKSRVITFQKTIFSTISSSTLKKRAESSF